MQSFGRERHWATIEAFYAGLLDGGLDFVAPTLAIVRSVISEGGSTKLSGNTSMHTLIVTRTPVQEWPDTIRVEVLTTGSEVRIVHTKIVRALRPYRPVVWADQIGDSIARPAHEAVPLFWRFCVEKFGVHPDRDTA